MEVATVSPTVAVLPTEVPTSYGKTLDIRDLYLRQITNAINEGTGEGWFETICP